LSNIKIDLNFDKKRQSRDIEKFSEAGDKDKLLKIEDINKTNSRNKFINNDIS
jgi:hypothetical protein